MDKPAQTAEMWFPLNDAALMVGIQPAVLLGWVRAGTFRPSIEVGGFIPNSMKYQFTESDVKRLGALVKARAKRESSRESSQPAAKAAFYSPAELAKVWGLSVDSIRKMFEQEPGVLKLGDESKKRRRKYVTLRIPADVAARVQKRLGS
jgi:hypothetical protein